MNMAGLHIKIWLPCLAESVGRERWADGAGQLASSSTIHLSVIIFLSELSSLHSLSSQRPMIARFFCRAELVASSQSQIGILDLNIADFRSKI